MVKLKTAKQKIKAGEPVICAFIRIPEPSIAEIMALCGVELLVIDAEHYQFNSETMVNIIRAADIYGMACLVRVTNTDHGTICRLLDMGAEGVLLADTVDAGQVKDLVDAVKYYPAGHRGVASESRGGLFGHLTDPKRFAEVNNDRTIIAAVIETKSAVEDINAILTIPELDIVSVGASDLSYAYGVPGQTKHPQQVALRKELYEKIVASGKTALDKASTIEDAKAAYKAGIRCFYVASDTVLLNEGLKNIIHPIKDSLFSSPSEAGS